MSQNNGLWNVKWDTNRLSNGYHSLVSKAYNADENVGESIPVIVNVANPMCQ